MNLEDRLQKFNKISKIHRAQNAQNIMFVEQIFDEGFRSEAFLRLEGILEVQMEYLWLNFLTFSTKSKTNPRNSSLGFNAYIEILWQIGFISKSQKNDLVYFHKGRNTVAHYASQHFRMKGHPPDKILEDQFQKGLKISNELTDVQNGLTDSLVNILKDELKAKKAKQGSKKNLRKSL